MDDVERGEQYAFISVDRRSKLIINWFVGKRTTINAIDFLSDLKKRMANRFQFTTDNWNSYSSAVPHVFGNEIDYATETKCFAKPLPFLPRRLIRIHRRNRIGSPDMRNATTAHAERTNLSVRLFNRRFTRCTLGYSKKLENLKHAFALFVWHFDFCRVHGSHGFTPAFAAGVAPKEPMTIEQLLSGKID
jgi:IS1 family transposase